MPTTTPALTEEEKDEQRLAELEMKMTDLLDLLAANVTRSESVKKEKAARTRVSERENEPRPRAKAFHKHASGSVSTTCLIRDKLAHLATLKERRRIHAHLRDTEFELNRDADEAIGLMDKIWERRAHKAKE